MDKKLILMILDGWGIGKKDNTDAIYNAKTPYMDYLAKTYPTAQLLTSGENVGLPDGQMGNSEVGHLNIGAGRVVYQDLVKINKACKENTIAKNETLVEALTYAKNTGAAVHFLGLVSDGGVHSLDKHLYKLCDITKDFGLTDVFIHAFTDGRDTDPESGLGFITQLEDHLKTSNGTIASLVGRYYAMDRDKRWERIKIAYDLLVDGKGAASTNIIDSVKASYAEGVTDEFIKPIVRINAKGEPVGKVKAGDVVICFNYRTDRLREMTTVLTQKDMPEHGMQTLPLNYVTMTRYDDTFIDVSVIYDKDNLTNTLGEVVSKAGKKQLRIAETEKYAHVTFFFSGGREEPYLNESRLMVQSPKVATYDLQPEMSAIEVKNLVVNELQKEELDFVCLNFANGDMVGHTGIWPAIVKAVETVDSCVKEVVETAKAHGYTAIIIADHGNADNAVNLDGSPNTAHSLNPVPFILVSDTYKKVNNGILADVAPTIISILGLEKPAEMDGKILIAE